MALQNVAIIGGGLMGSGIAQVFASAGHRVNIYEASEEIRATVIRRIAGSLQALGSPDLEFGQVQTSATLEEAVEGADVVFEAVSEKLELKQSIFGALERVTTVGCTLASNTSVIPIRDIAARLDDPSRVIGTHWWNPPYLVPLVEVVAGPASATRHIDNMVALLKAVGKKPVRVLKDVPGFVGNRLQHALWREAQFLVSEGVCDAETVDTVVKNSFGLRLAVLGPLENADLVGLDLTLDIHKVIIPQLSVLDRPNPLLEKLVAQGRLGFKSGSGFRQWTDAEIAETRSALLEHLLRMVSTPVAFTPNAIGPLERQQS